jgi:hypothetical protein
VSLWDKIKGLLGSNPANDIPAPGADADDDRSDRPAPHPPAVRPTTERPTTAGKQKQKQKKASAPAGTTKRRTSPEEDGRIEAAARALFEKGEPAAARAFLGEHAILLARHREQSSGLRCLCERCLDPSVATEDSHGIAYVLDFVVTRHRALFYWMPADLREDAKRVRASMRAAVRERLRALRSGEETTRHGINPFTKEPITFQPKRSRPRVNPFTGKRAP